MATAAKQITELVVLEGVPAALCEQLREVLPSRQVRVSRDRGVVEMPSLMHGVSWAAYDAILEAAGDHYFRHTYDRGTLEIMMSPTKGHEWVKCLLGRMVEAMCLDMNIPLQSVGSLTMRRRPLRKGLEPDECYYVAHEPQVRGKDTYEPEIDPPPDLAIEVDWTSSSRPRLPVFAALGVPEIWRWTGERLVFLRRKRTGDYEAIDRSRAFPYLSPGDFELCLSLRESRSENEVIMAFVRRARRARRKLADDESK